MKKMFYVCKFSDLLFYNKVCFALHAVMLFSRVYPGCTCFLLFMCHRTSVCGPAGDAAAYNSAAKNSR